MADFARSDSPAVQKQLDRLGPVSAAGDRLGLDRIAELCERLGRPQDRLPPLFHVAGTNGKGSTCAFLRAGLEAAGNRVHVFTSPHLVRFNERIRLAGRLIEDQPLAELLEEVIDTAAGIDASFFEVTTAAAFLAFSRSPAEACIVEVGLGGRLDATNIIERPVVCGIASLGLDHQQFLGSDPLGIAREKAAIAKRGAPLVTLAYDEQVMAAVAEIAEDKGASFHPAFRRWHYGVARGRLQYRDAGGALVDGDVRVFESAAILQYLGRTSGQFYPADEPTRRSLAGGPRRSAHSLDASPEGNLRSWPRISAQPSIPWRRIRSTIRTPCTRGRAASSPCSSPRAWARGS